MNFEFSLLLFPKTLTNSGDYACHPPRGLPRPRRSSRPNPRAQSPPRRSRPFPRRPTAAGSVARAEVRRASRCQLRLERHPPALHPVLVGAQVRVAEPCSSRARVADERLEGAVQRQRLVHAEIRLFSPSVRAESAWSHSPLRIHVLAQHPLWLLVDGVLERPEVQRLRLSQRGELSLAFVDVLASPLDPLVRSRRTISQVLQHPPVVALLLDRVLHIGLV